MSEEQPRGDAYDRIIGSIDGIPNSRKTKPATVASVTPMLGRAQSYIVQTYQTEDGFFGFVQMVDAEGRARIALPPKVMSAIYRQRESLIKSGRVARARERWENLSPAQQAAAVERLQSKVSTDE